MKIPPKKPHFFKPLQPGFKNGLKIPIGFLKYLKGNDQIEHAILRRDGNKWPTKVNDPRSEAGWAEFVQQYDLQLGDILMFRHEGNMEFEVSIFDSTHCDREYAEYMQEGGGGGGAHTEDATERPMMRMIKSSTKASSPVKTATHHKSFGHFECIIREYCIRRGYLYLPRRFAIANGLINKKCDLIIRDERQRLWNFKLSSSITQTYIIGCGWTKFFADNCLRKGDRIMFEVVTNGETPIWKFQVTNREAPLLKFQGMFILIEPISYFFDDLYSLSYLCIILRCLYKYTSWITFYMLPKVCKLSSFTLFT
uniref:DNA binding protein n=2 Tax=Solanum tuberosum TaxID=4113 RepID=M1B269_SOLTU